MEWWLKGETGTVSEDYFELRLGYCRDRVVAAHDIPVQVSGAFGIAEYGGSARELRNLCRGRRYLGLFA